MASNKVQIQVELKGAQQVNKQLDSIEKSSVDLSEGFKGVGESFKSVGDVVKAQGGLMGDAFGVLGESVGAITDSVGSFKDSMELAGQTGGKAWLAMLGPIAAVVSGVSLAIEAYREFSGANRAAEDAAENMAAAASDTASRLEAMVEAGVDLSSGALKEFIQVNERARLAMEETIKANEKRTVSDQKVKAAVQAVKDAEESLFFTDMRVAMATRDLELATTQYNKALDEQVKKSKEANKLNKEAFELQELQTKSYKELLQTYEDQLDALDNLKVEMATNANLGEENRAIIEEELRLRSESIAEIARYRESLVQLDKVLEAGNITQEQYDNAVKETKKHIVEKTKAIEASTEKLKPFAKALQVTTDYTKKLNDINKEATKSTGELGNSFKNSLASEMSKSLDELTRKMLLVDRSIIDQKDILTDVGREFKNTLEQNLKSLTKAITESHFLVKEIDDQIKREMIETNHEMKRDEKERLEELLLDKKAYSYEAKKLEEQIYKDMVKLEEEKIDLQWQTKVAEINGMEVSGRRRKQLLDEAKRDAVYQTERLKQTTNNEVKNRIAALVEVAEQEKYMNKLRDNELTKANELELLASFSQQNRLLEIRANAAADLKETASKLNRELAESNNEYDIKVFSSELKSKNKEIELLKKHIERKKAILESDRLQLSFIDKERLDKEIVDLTNQQKVKETEVKAFFHNNLIITKSHQLKLEQARLEEFVQSERYQKDYTSIFLDNDQIRTNASVYFYELENQRIMRNFEREKQSIEEKITMQERLFEIKRKNSEKISRPGTESVTNLLINAQINEEKAKIQGLYNERDKYNKMQEEQKKLINERMYQYDLEHYQAVGSLIKDFSATSAQAFIDAGVAAAFAGESISNAIRTTLRGLAQEATARALFEGAAALGSLAIGDARGAALHGKSALAFGVAAVGMGALTAAVGVPGGGSSGGGGTTSPTGLSQTSEAPQRESAKTEAMVFNINFGNAVIYDTRAAAERAMAERVMELGTRARRGYNPPRPRI